MKIAPLLAVLAVLPALSLASAPEASACGMSVQLGPPPKPQQKKTPVQNVAAAEQSLEAGQPLVAVKAVVASFPKIREAVAGNDPVETRAIRVFALAVVRSNGAASERAAGVPGAAEWAPAGNLAWAVESLREIDAKRPNDPTVQADLGEALARLPAKQPEALALLGKLAEKDLMGSPFAYAALARLRAEKGDAAGAEAAVKKCEEMSKSPGLCKPAKNAVAKA